MDIKRKTLHIWLAVLSSASVWVLDFSFEWYKELSKINRFETILGVIFFILLELLALIRIIKQSNNPNGTYRSAIILLWAFLIFCFYDKRVDIISDFCFPVLVILSSLTLNIMILLKKDNYNELDNEIDTEKTATSRKYRNIYYSLPLCFSNNVDESEYINWFDNLNYSDESDTMLIVEFIKEFNVSKAEFDIMNQEYFDYIEKKIGGFPCICPVDYPEQEQDEIFNSEIIFTFDNETINNYYLKPTYRFSCKEEYQASCCIGESKE